MKLSRRGLFGLGAAFLAAPSIVRVASIMPVSSTHLASYRWVERSVRLNNGVEMDLWVPDVIDPVWFQEKIIKAHQATHDEMARMLFGGGGRLFDA